MKTVLCWAVEAGNRPISYNCCHSGGALMCSEVEVLGAKVVAGRVYSDASAGLVGGLVMRSPRAWRPVPLMLKGWEWQAYWREPCSAGTKGLGAQLVSSS